MKDFAQWVDTFIKEDPKNGVHINAVKTRATGLFHTYLIYNQFVRNVSNAKIN